MYLHEICRENSEAGLRACLDGDFGSRLFAVEFIIGSGVSNESTGFIVTSH